MAGHLLSLVVGQALAQRRTDGIELGCEGRQRSGGSGIFHARQQHQTAGALNEHADRGLVAGTLDEIAFPVARHDAVSDFRRAHVDADHVRDLATPIRATTAPQARAMAMTQAGDEFTAQFTPSMGIDGGIDGVRGHVELALVRKDPLERSRYLLQRPLPAEQGAHHAPAHTLRMQLAVAAGTALTGDCTQLRMVGTVALPRIGIMGHLATNGRRRSFQSTGNRPHTGAALSHRGDSDAVLRLKLLVSGRFLHGHTLQEKVLHFIFEAAPCEN